MTDHDRGEVGRDLVVSLDEVTEVLHVTDRKDALATVLLELLEQVRSVDAGDEGPLGGERLRYIAQAVVPAPITGEKQREVLDLPLRLIDVHVVETTMRERLARGKSGGTGDHAEQSQTQECERAADRQRIQITHRVGVYRIGHRRIAGRRRAAEDQLSCVAQNPSAILPCLLLGTAPPTISYD